MKYHLQTILIFLIVVAGVGWLNIRESKAIFGLSLYGGITISYLLTKLLLSSFYRSYKGAVPYRLSLAAVIPVYNEDPEIFSKCLQSILDQTRVPDEIYVIDDGSLSNECMLLAQGVLESHKNAKVIPLEENRGKRHAQAEAFRQVRSDLIVTVDSDTVLEKAAVEEGMRPFFDPKTQAVCGNVRAYNRKKNILTHLIDLRYCNAFQYERSAYSVLGSVLCSSGILSFWKTEMIQENLENYLDQKFMGLPVTAGDDRHLTFYALQKGKVVFQETAKSMTVVPEDLISFAKQQIRWNKSFFRETLHMLKKCPARRAAWWLSLFELSLWITFSVAFLAMIFIRPLAGGRTLGVYYLGYLALMAYARSVRYSRENFFVYLLSPLYGLIHIFLLMPLRLYSLATIKNSAWGTRDK